MKLNFKYCKKCEVESAFKNTQYGFTFYCEDCGAFFFKNKKYHEKLFNEWINTQKIKKIQMVDIESMKIVRYNDGNFKRCPYLLEHLVGN